jgi:hypothetical protein
MADKWTKQLAHLEVNGKRAPATVLEMSRSGTEVSKGNLGVLDLVGLGGGSEERYHVRTATLRVRPEGEDEFEVHEKMRFAEYSVPDPGEEFEVLYDPADRSQIAVAPPSAEQLQAAAKEAEGAEIKAGFTLDLSRFTRGRKK